MIGRCMVVHNNEDDLGRGEKSNSRVDGNSGPGYVLHSPVFVIYCEVILWAFFSVVVGVYSMNKLRNACKYQLPTPCEGMQ